MYVTKLSCTCRKRIKGRKEKKKKQKLDTSKVKRENKINIIIYTRIYLPDNGAKNMKILKIINMIVETVVTHFWIPTKIKKLKRKKPKTM